MSKNSNNEDQEREIPLTQGMVALVDSEDYERLKRHKWHAAEKASGLWYARRNVTIPNTSGRRQTSEFMHCAIAGVAMGEVDHRDGNGLNNTKSNLRNCTHRQNSMNRKANAGRKWKGIWRAGKNFRAAITVRDKQIHLGCFATEEEGARAYDLKARELFGEFARLNFPEGEGGKSL
jgi:hypothetical protein